MATGLMLTACQSDDIVVDNNDIVAKADKTVYVNLSISGDLGTRANGANGGLAGDPTDNTTDFDPGTNEAAVNNAYLVFYDEDGNMVGELVPLSLTGTGTTGTNTVDKFYKNVVPVSIFKGEKDPAQVICYINPVSPASLQTSLDQIQTITRDRVQSGTGSTLYFPMSNSVYYPTTGTTDEPLVAYPIQEGMLFDTESEAMDAMEADQHILDIYVERYAAKLAFDATSAEQEPYQTYSTTVDPETGNASAVSVVLNFVPEGWALNAEANETYVVKSFREFGQGGNILANNFSYGKINGLLNVNTWDYIGDGSLLPDGLTSLSTANSWAWNNPTYHRSYWAISPAYFVGSYPEVSSDLTGDEPQNYLSYNDIITKGAGYKGDDTAAKYFKETTVGYAALNSKNPVAAMPCVLFVGNYKVTVNGTELPDNTTFYTYIKASNGNATVYFENNAGNLTSKPGQGESMLKRFIDQATVIYTKNADGTYERINTSDATFNQALAGIFEVDFPEATNTADGDYKISSNRRTLQFVANPDFEETGDIYVADGNGYKKVTTSATPAAGEISIADANEVIMGQVGFAVEYHSGHAYYNIPVKHYGWYRPGNTQKDATSINWQIVRAGDFGMVRNHSYQINVSKISGLATGIGGDDVEIVPPAETKDYYVAYRVNILKWAVVPTQNVSL